MNELIVVKDNKLIKRLNKKKVAICIIILVFILLAFIALVILLKVYKTKNEIEVVSKAKEEQIKTIQQVEMERRLKEKELEDAKLANRNKNEFTLEQIEKVNNIYKSSQTKVAYLTFDDGPSKSVTPLILDILKQEGIKVTFFVLGSNVKENPDLVKRENQEQHYIANHGYSHKYALIYSTIQAVLDEYNYTEECIRNALGDVNYKSRIFRFPGGSIGGKYHDLKQEAKQLLVQNNIVHLDWNSLTGDAEGAITKESIMENLKNTVSGKNNIVILMHDSANKILTYETLPDIISFLKEEGYVFGDLYDLIGE